MRYVVLAGGLSPEREVSLSSGSLIAAALARNGHEICLLDPYTGLGADGLPPAFSRLPPEPRPVAPGIPDLEALKARVGRGERRIADGVLDWCRRGDAVFLALHGDVGENGRLQALLDMEGIPYTGSGYAGCLLAMDKDLSKRLLTRASVPTPPWVLCRAGDGTEASAARIAREIGFPCVVKPCGSGSSLGVSAAEEPEELTRALTEAARFDSLILAERRIFGREMAVSLLGRRALPAVEIRPQGGFYDYRHKYQAGTTEEVCPAPLTDAERDALVSSSLRAFDALRLSGYARFDFILDGDGVPWCLEANALPGMTPTSLLPRAAAAAGITYDALCERIARAALERGPLGEG